VGSAVSNSTMRPVVIVLLDPTSDRCSCFFQAAILRRPDFLLFQAAMESFDVAVAFRVMISRPPMGDAKASKRFQKARRSELCPIARCPICGGQMRKGAYCCPGCAPLVSRTHLLQAARLGRIATHTPIAEARRSATYVKQVEALSKWDPSQLPKWLDEDFYRARVMPKLTNTTIKKIRTAIDVSHPYAAMIRNGHRIPHPRHWMALADLVCVSAL